MKNQTRKRNYLAKSLLIEELRLSRSYRVLTHEDTRLQEYRERIVKAADKTVEFFAGNNEQQEFAKAIILHGNSDMVKLCQEFNISQGTYYNWRNRLLYWFGVFANIPMGGKHE